MPKRFSRAEGSEGRPLNAVVLQSCSATLQTGIEGLTALGRVETSTASFNRFDDERIHKTSTATLHSSNHPACIPVANNAIDDIDDVEVELAKDNEMKRKRSIHDRPEEWKTIAEYYDQWGKNKTWEYFKELFGDRTQRSVEQALKTWSNDLKCNKEGIKGKRAPAYGFEIDFLLLDEVKERITNNLPVDDVTLHSLLINQLKTHNKLNLMMENGGNNLFLHGWAGRFWKRHNLPSRLISASSKIKFQPQKSAVIPSQIRSAVIPSVIRSAVIPSLIRTVMPKQIPTKIQTQIPTQTATQTAAQILFNTQIQTQINSDAKCDTQTKSDIQLKCSAEINFSTQKNFSAEIYHDQSQLLLSLSQPSSYFF